MHGNQRQTQWAYIAGILDADGCFMISRHKRKTKTGVTERALRFPKNVKEWAVFYGSRIKIAMIEEEAINFILSIGYGNSYLTGARKDRPKSKQIHQWYLDNREKVIEFLENVIPFLKVKKNRAIHLLEFTKYLKNSPNPCYKGVSQDELNYREDSYLKMREFNGNKVAATTKSLRPEKVSDSLIS